jgi:hypothetical protein
VVQMPLTRSLQVSAMALRVSRACTDIGF